MNSEFLLGLIAGACTTAAFVPQLAKVWKTRSTKDLSLSMFIVFTTGVLLWLLYGIYRKDLLITGWNAVTLVLAGMILIFKLRYH